MLTNLRPFHLSNPPLTRSRWQLSAECAPTSSARMSVVTLAADGPSQMALADVAFARALAHAKDAKGRSLTVLTPSDAVSAYKLVLAMAEHDGPVYLRAVRVDLPILYGEDASFPLRGSKVVVRRPKRPLRAGGVGLSRPFLSRGGSGARAARHCRGAAYPEERPHRRARQSASNAARNGQVARCCRDRRVLQRVARDFLPGNQSGLPGTAWSLLGPSSCRIHRLR
jgi:hypothetical protein